MSLDSPYKGLDAFDDSDLDALLFFGREREREIVRANLIASRLTVLYGPTGVGKSSLLRAGVARALRELPEEPNVIVFDHWGDDPSADLAAAVAEASGEVGANGLLEVVEHAQRTRDVYLILDQTEEYFVYHGEGAAFDAELAHLVGDPLRVNVLLSLREDSLAKLDRFKPRLPAVYANSLRLDRLDRESGRMAIVRPVERWNELEEERLAVDPALVDAVLDGVRAGGIEQGAGGLGTVEGNGRPSTVEAPYLQLVMQRIWEVERAASSQVLRAETLAELGGARQVVADHLERAVEALTPHERDVAAQLFTYLVTPSGTKIAHELPDLAEYAGLTEQEAAPVVETLSRHRIMRRDEAGRTEIFHDVLAGEVLAWRRTHGAERALELERAESRRRHRRLLAVIALGAVALAVMAAVTVYALSQRSDARHQAQVAKARELEARASEELDRDPELSLLLAVAAANLAPSGGSEDTLRAALLKSRVRTVVQVGEPLLSAASQGNHLLSATSTGNVVEADAATGRKTNMISTGERATLASFSGDGTALLTGRDGRLRVVRPSGDVAAIRGVRGARGAALSSDGLLAVVLVGTGARLIEVKTGRVLETFPHRGAVSAAISRDNRRVVTGGVDSAVRAWDARTGKLVRTLPNQQGHAVAVALTPSGLVVASASTDQLGRIWRFRGGGLTGVLSGHANALTDVAFSTDGDHVVTASKDGTARVSKADTGAPLIVLSGDTDWVTSAAFSGPAGSSVVSASRDGEMRVWDANVQPQLTELARLPAPVTAVGFLRAGLVRADTRDGKTVVVNSATGKPVDVRPLPPAPARRPHRVVGPDGTMATIRGNTVVLRTDGRTTVLKGHRARVTSVAFSPDGARVATASLDHDVRIWDAGSGVSLFTPLRHNSAVYDAEFSPDGRWVVTAAGKAALWDARNGAVVVRLQGHNGVVTSATFDPMGRTIVTGGVDGTVRAYNCQICGGIDDLIAIARARLAATGRRLTPAERAQFLR